MDENNESMTSSEDIVNKSTVFPDCKGEKFNGSFNANGAPVIKIIGVGGGGGSAVNHMYEEQIYGVSYVVVNTDRQALSQMSIPDKVLLGPGEGAGGIAEEGRKIAEDCIDDINNLFDKDTRMVFITAGMGGGTGTGASPVIARVAREKGILTVGIVTIPFLFEGRRKIRMALDGAQEMGKYVDAMMIINNELLTEIYPDYSLDSAFRKADDILTVAARSISNMINIYGPTNLDIKDVTTALKDSRTAIISTGMGEGENRMTKAIEDALNSPLLRNRDVASSQAILFDFYYADEEHADNPLKAVEINELTDFMDQLPDNVFVKFGRKIDNSLGDKIRMTILASGFNVTVVEQDDKKNRPPRVRKGSGQKPANSDSDDDKRIEEAYGAEKMDERRIKQVRKRMIIFEPGQMDDDRLIDFFEKNPTYKRGTDYTLQEEQRNLLTGTTPAKEESKPKQDNGSTQKKSINFGEND